MSAVSLERRTTLEKYKKESRREKQENELQLQENKATLFADRRRVKFKQQGDAFRQY